MDTEEDAAEYAAIAHDEVNALFAAQVVALFPAAGRLVDLGTGPGDIAVRIAEASALEVVGVDLAQSMLAIARGAAASSAARARLSFVCADVKATGFPAESFDGVVSNSVAHHVHEPTRLFAEIARLARSDAALFVKDLLRPESEEQLLALVDRYASNDTPHQRELFRCSLHAALTLDEVRQCCSDAGLGGITVAQVSDRHWVVQRASGVAR